MAKIIWFLSFILPTFCFGGQIILTNGDHLTGTVTQMADGKVIVQTDLAGTVEIAVNNIRSITTALAVDIVYDDGTTATKPLTAETPLDGLQAINPPKPEKPRWKGDVSGGLAYTTGNTKNEAYNFSANLKKRTQQSRTTLKADTVRKKEQASGSSTKVTTEDWLKTIGKYDYFLSKKSYLFGEGRYETDETADLDSRIIFGGGSGYQWIESEKTSFSTEAGLSCVREEYKNNISDSKLSARAGYHFDHVFNNTLTFYHDLTLFPSTEDISDYYLTGSAELRAKLGSSWFVNAKVLLDYDTTPAADKASTDIKYLLGAGISF